MILPILLCTNSDADQAESLLDFIALMRGKQPAGRLLLACHAIHVETQLRLKVSAEIGFSHVEVLDVPRFDPTPASKAQSVNLFYQRVLQHGLRNYKGPFLMMEPDTTPTGPDWLTPLEDAYAASPKLYLSSVLADPKGIKCIGRNGVFPRGAAMDIGQLFTGATLFEIAAGEALVARTEKTRLLQVLPIIVAEDLAKVRPDAVMVHGDKKGFLLAKLREELGKLTPATNGSGRGLDLTAVPPLTEEARSIADQAPPELPIINPAPIHSSLIVQKLDARTRAGRMAKLAQKAEL